MQRNDYSDIESYNLRQLDSTIVQTWISDLAARKSPKKREKYLRIAHGKSGYVCSGSALEGISSGSDQARSALSG